MEEELACLRSILCFLFWGALVGLKKGYQVTIALGFPFQWTSKVTSNFCSFCKILNIAIQEKIPESGERELSTCLCDHGILLGSLYPQTIM